MYAISYLVSRDIVSTKEHTDEVELRILTLDHACWGYELIIIEVRHSLLLYLYLFVCMSVLHLAPKGTRVFCSCSSISVELYFEAVTTQVLFGFLSDQINDDSHSQVKLINQSASIVSEVLSLLMLALFITIKKSFPGTMIILRAKQQRHTLAL